MTGTYQTAAQTVSPPAEMFLALANHGPDSHSKGPIEFLDTMGRSSDPCVFGRRDGKQVKCVGTRP